MKISRVEFGKVSTNTAAQTKILPETMTKFSFDVAASRKTQLSPLEKGMIVAKEAINELPDTREEIVSSLRKRIQTGEYTIDGNEVADMMMRRLAADKIR
jgi:flagellar biosynthesis anti-sigma factor FlgM